MKIATSFLLLTSVFFNYSAVASETTADTNTVEVVKGIATYYTKYYGGSTFSDLEQLGVQMAAVNNGMRKCAEKGLTDCVAVSWSLDGCNVEKPELDRKECSATAVIRGRTAQ